VAWQIGGIIEGFYGRPWSWDERAELMRFCHERGMTHYVYAPKDDPKHRSQWHAPYTSEELDGFARLVGEKTLCIGFAISPGLSIDCVRARSVVAHGFDLHGEPLVVEGSELLARAIQHETDHLDGILFIDRLDREARRAAMKTIRESEWFGTDTQVRISPHATGGLGL